MAGAAGDTDATPPKAPGADEPFGSAAIPVIAFAEAIAQGRRRPAAELIRETVALLDRFCAQVQRAGVPPASVLPARLALALIVDQRARAARWLDLAGWSAGVHRTLFDGRDMSAERLRDFGQRARAAGPDFAAAAVFLEGCQAHLQASRRHFDRSTGPNWTGMVTVLVVAFLLAVGAWASFVEWRFHAQLRRAFDAEALAIGLDRAGPFPDLAPRLDALARARDRVARQAVRAPIRLLAAVAGWDAPAHADAVYRQAVDRHVPGALALAVDDAIASDGDPVLLYDTLRAWSVLSGTDRFVPQYLAGWLADRGAEDPRLRSLAGHVRFLSAAPAGLPAPDAELLDQARAFAAEASEADRAFIELLRSPEAADLPGWSLPERVPGLVGVLQRRSGRDLSDPVPGLFTAAGWVYARDIGAGVAVRTARAEAQILFAGQTLPTRNESPDKVMERLQADTLDRWSDLVSDLRVIPFAEPDAAILVSGRLGATDTPLAALVREIWDQAGGNDRLRPHELQISIATRFGPMIQYVEQGRMSDISTIFATLNVALGTLDRDQETGLDRLMSVQDRAQSIAALRQAPALVVQIVEDALAQTAEAHADMLTNPLTRAWQAEVLPACQAAVAGRFPFDASGPDADLADVQRLLAPGGTLDRFYRQRVAPYIDTSGEAWRWKPEARFSGVAADSAEFFHRALALSSGLVRSDGRLGSEFSLTALAERGKAVMTIGGSGGAVDTATESLRLAWPGTDPAAGVDIGFETPDGQARILEPGPWGLMRLLLPLRLRERDGGQRFLVDLKKGPARLFVEIGFASPDNPLARRKLIDGFACPPVL